MRSIIQSQLAAKLPPKLVDELLEAHSEAKRNYYLGGLRLSEVEGGRFCEAAFRLLELITQGNFTPLGTQLNTVKIIQDLGKLSKGAHPDSIRVHIPRALRLVYDIRNQRDVAHLGDGSVGMAEAHSFAHNHRKEFQFHYCRICAEIVT
jgi:hypothetical protein